MTSMGIPQRVLDKLVDTVGKDLLNGKKEQSAKDDIAVRIGRPVTDPQVERLYKEARKKSGIDYKVYEPEDTNTTIRDSQIKELVTTAITGIEQGGDNEEIITNVEDKLKKMKVSEGNIQKYLNQIYDHFDHEVKKDEEKEEFLLKEGEELIPLPRVDIDYDELQNINLEDDEEESVYPPVDKDMLTPKDIADAKNYEKLDERGKEKYTENIFRTQGKLVQETRQLEDYIRQVKICAITVPLPISKLRMEDLLIKYLQRIREKFRNIYVFGWEKQINTEFYKSFDELFKMNDENEGALFIIRDLKTFNVYASDLFRFKITRNYFVILIDGLVKKEDLALVENITGGNGYLWPAFLQLVVTNKLVPQKSIIYGKHAKAYLDSISSAFPRPFGKESWSSMEGNSNVLAIGRKVLSVDLTKDDISGRTTGTNLISLTKPPLNLEEAISRSPKYRDMIISILANAGSRILVKLLPGESGLEGFSYIYEKLKKIPIRPVIIRKTDDYNSKRGKIKSIPEMGPCLIFTDYTLVDQLIPKNIEKFYISGGGDKEDIETILDLSKAINYTGNKYPRYIEIKNFVSVLEAGIPETIDEVEYEAFSNMLASTLENYEKIRTLSSQIVTLADKLVIREKDF